MLSSPCVNWSMWSSNWGSLLKCQNPWGTWHFRLGNWLLYGTVSSRAGFLASLGSRDLSRHQRHLQCVTHGHTSPQLWELRQQRRNKEEMKAIRLETQMRYEFVARKRCSGYVEVPLVSSLKPFVIICQCSPLLSKKD